jgi:PAS domain S-box-containing protein/putative nucleotidyltransferase with HDIG domain
MAGGKMQINENAFNYKDLYEFAPVGYVTLDAQGLICQVNRAGCALIGVECIALIGQPLSQRVTRATLPALNAFLARVFTEPVKQMVEVAFQKNENQIVYVRLEGVASEGGQYCHMGVVDISDFKNKEAALRRIEDEFHTLARVFPVGVFRADVQGNTLYSNEKMLSFVGVSAEEAFGQGWAQTIFPEDRERVLKEWQRCIQQGLPYEMQYRLIHKEGGVAWVKGQAEAIRDAGGKVTGYVGTITDISDLIQAEEALRSSEEKYHQLFEVGADALFLVDRENGRFLEVNMAAVKLYGYSREELLRMGNMDLSAEPEATHRVTTQEKIEKIPLRWNRKKDGSVFPVEILISHLTWQGKPAHLAVVRDITLRRQVEQKVEYLSRLPQENPNPILRVSHDGHLLFANKASQPLLDHWKVEVGQFLPEDWCGWVQEIYQSQLSRTVEITCSDQVFACGLTPIAGEDYINIYGREVTAREQALKALKESDLRFRAVFDQSSNPMEVSKGGVHLYANPAYLHLFGYDDNNELSGKSVLDLYAPDARPQIQEYVSKRAQGEDAPTEYETRGLRKDGSEFDLDVHISTYELNGEIYTVPILRDITESKRAEISLAQQTAELQKRNNELWRLYRMSASLISGIPSDLHNLAQSIAENVIREFGKAHCSLFLIQKNSNEIIYLALAGPHKDQVAGPTITLDGPGLIPQAIRTQDVVYVADVHSNANYLEAWPMAQSELVIPLKVNNQVIGALDVQSEERNGFSPDDERLLLILANQAAVVLENAKLEAETQLQMQRLQSLRSIDETINASLDLTFTSYVILEQIIAHLNVDAADILLLNSQSKYLKYILGQGFRTETPHQSHLRLEQSLSGRAVIDREVVHIRNLNQQSEILNLFPRLKDEQFVEYYGVPLIAKGTVKGLLEIFLRSPLITDETWHSFLDTLAGQAAIAIDNIEMFENLQRSNHELTMAYDENIEGWSRTLDLRDKETEGHTKRVTEITIKLAQSAGVGDEDLLYIRWGALLHDIGKMGVRDNILLKEGPLTEEEWMLMRNHPLYAFDLLSPIAFLKQAVDIPYCHHERWDGKGYPRGLKGEQIPFSARLFSLVDVWDALTHDRPYRAAWTKEKVKEYILQQSEKAFDPRIVELFCNSYLLESGEEPDNR